MYKAYQAMADGVKQGLRVGQAFMNFICEEDRDLYERMTGTHCDCFYDNQKVGKAIQAYLSGEIPDDDNDNEYNFDGKFES